MKKIKKMITGIMAILIVMAPSVSCSADKSHKAGSLSIAEETTTDTTEESSMETTTKATTKKTKSTTKKTTAKTTQPSETTTRTTVPPVTEPVTEAEAVPAQDYGERANIGGTEIVWLSDYDLNAQVGQKRPTPVALFEDIYGGKIRYVQTSLKNKYYTFSSMLLAGDQLDMVEYQQGTYPNGVLSQQYQPLDPYFRSMGLNYDIWENMEDIIDALSYKGEHYIIPYSFSNPLVLMYSRKLIRDYGLTDPYDLYKNDQWTWDNFLNISETYRNKTGKSAVRGGKFGDAVIHSTGFRIIGSRNGNLVNNINQASIRYAELFMQELGRKSLFTVSSNEEFSTETLFFATESWILGTENVKNPNMDLMVVPVPKKEGTDGNYITCDFDAKMLVKNSTMGDAVATYIMCERIVASQPEYKAGAKAYATTPVQFSGSVKSYITAEQYDALQTYLDPKITMPMFDYIWAMNDPEGVMAGLSNSFLINGGYETDWKNLRNLYHDKINQMINEY